MKQQAGQKGKVLQEFEQSAPVKVLAHPLLATVLRGETPSNGRQKKVLRPRMTKSLLLLPEVADRSPQVLESHG
jgi:hypothetical protein